MNYTEAPRNSAVYVSAISTLNQVVFKKKKLKKKKEKETPSLVDHQIGMGLNNNFIQALSLYSAPTLCIFSYQKNTLLGQPFLSNTTITQRDFIKYQCWAIPPEILIYLTWAGAQALAFPKIPWVMMGLRTTAEQSLGVRQS